MPLTTCCLRRRRPPLRTQVYRSCARSSRARPARTRVQIAFLPSRLAATDAPASPAASSAWLGALPTATLTSVPGAARAGAIGPNVVAARSGSTTHPAVAMAAAIAVWVAATVAAAEAARAQAAPGASPLAAVPAMASNAASNAVAAAHPGVHSLQPVFPGLRVRLPGHQPTVLLPVPRAATWKQNPPAGSSTESRKRARTAGIKCRSAKKWQTLANAQRPSLAPTRPARASSSSCTALNLRHAEVSLASSEDGRVQVPQALPGTRPVEAWLEHPLSSRQ
jgi:hypothetical protein